MPADKENFVHLVKVQLEQINIIISIIIIILIITRNICLHQELKEAFAQPGYLLTAAISANIGMIDLGYDIPQISKYLDYIHIMAYDYHGTWDSKVLPNSPMSSQDNLSVVKHYKCTLDIYWKKFVWSSC